jgi:hypothetical protein
MLKSGVLALGLSLAAGACAQTIGVFVNGEPVQFSGGIGAQRVEGRVMVPLRGVMEKLGAYVSYQASTKTVTANRGDVDLQLTLGQRRAILNGRDVMLDVPAMEYRGSTLVPLRFMSEALGADVIWDGAAYAVRISTSGNAGGGNNPPVDPPTTGGSIEIDSFDVNVDGALRAGSTVEFRLQGTPGGTATVQIPGVVKDLALRESNRGIYTGSYTIPENSRTPITVSKATAIARLKVGREERLIQSSSTIQVDNQPPSISSTTPDMNGRVNNLRPNITAVFDDQSGTGVDSNAVRLVVDGKDVTNDATITSSLLAYKPNNELTAGRHQVDLEVRDRAGNRATKTWTFNIIDKANVITSFKHDATREMQPGDEVTFTLTGEPKATVSLKLGDIKTLNMEETTAGKYVATYVVRRTDRLDGIVATARMKTASGETFTTDLTLGSKVADNQPLGVPKITSHENGQSVERNIILKGKAAPNAKVQIRIDFSQKIFNAIPMTGLIAEIEVEADAKGNWETREIDLDTGLGRSNITYTVSAVTAGADDKRSEVAKITLKR